MMLSVDPATCSGWALWYLGRLVDCGVAESPGEARPSAVTDIVIESQDRVDPKAPAEDILKVARIAGYWAGYFGALYGARLHWIEPSAWKRQVPKPGRAADPYIIDRRVRAALDDKELALYRAEAPSAARKLWDLADAVGIGLVHLGRREPGLL